MFSEICQFNRIALVAILLMIGDCPGCSHPQDEIRLSNMAQDVPDGSQGAVVRSSRQLMGTTFKLSVWTLAGDQQEGALAVQHALDLVASIEGKISSWDSESETAAVNRSMGEAVSIGPELHDLLQVSLSWAQQTDGAFDITGGPLFERWRRARQAGVLPTRAEIRSVLESTGYESVILGKHTVRLAKPDMQIDFGAIGKGFAADRASDLLRDRGFENFIIDAGGDVLVSGSHGGSPWQIAIQHPRRSGYLGVIGASNRAIATSGDYEQFTVIDGVRYSHILDPRFGWPARHLASVTVMTRWGVDADALATALFVMGPTHGLAYVEDLDDTETLMVLDDGTTRSSTGLRLNNGRLELQP